MPTDFGKGAVAVNPRGQLFVVLGRLYGARGVEKGWYGIGFNGEAVVGSVPEFIAPNLNVYLTQISEEPRNVKSHADVAGIVPE